MASDREWIKAFRPLDRVNEPMTASVADAVYSATDGLGINFRTLASELISRGWTYNGK